MIWLFIITFFAISIFVGVELYLFFRKPKTQHWQNMSEWAWRRKVKRDIDDLLDQS